MQKLLRFLKIFLLFIALWVQALIRGCSHLFSRRVILFTVIAVFLCGVGGGAYFLYSLFKEAQQINTLGIDGDGVSVKRYKEVETHTHAQKKDLPKDTHGATVHGVAHTHVHAHHISGATDTNDGFCTLPAQNFLTLIVTDLGLDEHITDRAIQELPKEVVLAFSPYAKMLNQWSVPVKTSGHQFVLQLHSEQHLDSVDILSYFDAVLLLSVNDPEKNITLIDDFLFKLKDGDKMIIEGRFLYESRLAYRAQKKNTPLICINGKVDADTIMVDKVDFLKQKGVVLISSVLVPYLIEQIEKNPDLILHPLPKKKA